MPNKSVPLPPRFAWPEIFLLSGELQRVHAIITPVTASWTTLHFDSSTLEKISYEANAGNLILRQIGLDLLSAIRRITRPEDHVQIQAAFELYAEAVVCLCLQAKNVFCDRTPGTGKHKQKRPDLRCDLNGTQFFVEVKTLDIVGGVSTHASIASNAMNAKAEADNQTKTKRVGIGPPVELSTYPAGARRADRIELLTNKIDNALKGGQLRFGPTVLFVVLDRLPGDSTHPSTLAPVFYDFTVQPYCFASGELWHVAFAKPGYLILDWTEAEGFPNVDRTISVEGILRTHPYLIGIIFVCRNLRGDYSLFGVNITNPDFSSLSSQTSFTEHDMLKVMSTLSDARNDEENSLGYRLQLRI